MKLKEKVSLDEFDGKRFQNRLADPKENKKAVLTHYLHNIYNGISKHYEKDALKVLKEYVAYKTDEENLPLAKENKKAVLTHYLHNIYNGISKHYEKDALKVLKEYVAYKTDEENLPLAKEYALQEFLSEVENVPFPTPHNYTFKFIDL